MRGKLVSVLLLATFVGLSTRLNVVAAETNQYLSPPTSINLQFDRQNSDIYPAVYAKSGILDAISYRMTLDVSSDGKFSKTIAIPNQNFSASNFANGAPEDGNFTLTGTYNKGNISAEWTFELNIPARKGWNYPDNYTGKGIFYTTDIISENSGTGTIEGNISRTYTKWTDVKMVDHTTLTDTANFKNTWRTINSCKEVICGCRDVDDAVDSKARFNSITGEVGYAHCSKSDKSEEWIPAIPKTKLMVNDHISTGPDSFATLQFGDMTTFQMKPDTEVIVKSPPEQESKLGLVSGHLWINFKKMLTNGTMEVEMGQAVAGIKGTTLVLEQVNGSSTLKVIEGVVSFTPKGSSVSADINAGEKVTAGNDGLSPVEKFDVVQENAGWQAAKDLKSTKGSLQATNQSYLIIIAVVITGLLGLFILIRKLKFKHFDKPHIKE
jgi:hypothetical protein